jgi:ribosomal protein L32
MAHPKRRISKACKRKRRSHLALKPEVVVKDPRSGALTRSHRINEKESTHYGFDKGGQGGREVFEREDF